MIYVIVKIILDYLKKIVHTLFTIIRNYSDVFCEGSPLTV